MRLPVFTAALLIASAPAFAASVPVAEPALITDAAAEIAFDPAAGAAKESLTVFGFAASGLGAASFQIDGAPTDPGFAPKLTVSSSDFSTLFEGVMKAFSFEGGVLRMLFSTTADMTGQFRDGAVVTLPSGGAADFSQSFSAAGAASIAAPVPLPAAGFLLLGALAMFGARPRAARSAALQRAG